jgi:hypothetical protein
LVWAKTPDKPGEKVLLGLLWLPILVVLWWVGRGNKAKP